LQPQAPTQSGDHTANAQTHQDTESQAPITGKVDNRQACEECSKKDPIAAQDPDKWVRRGFWINTALVLITLVIAIATLRQANAVKKQTGHVVASERAWLKAEVINPDPPEDTRLIWIEIPITNRGKTPARVHNIEVTSKLVPPPTDSVADATPGKLPLYPDYSDRERVMGLRNYDLIIAPEDTFRHMHVYIRPREWNQIRARELTLYVYGSIDYFDTVGGDCHTTSFCSIYAVPLPNFYNEPTGFMFTPYIPSTYFRAT
jgi:hypothetical protein